MDISYHYPPELFQLLVDTIPRLCPRKRDVVVFFRGAGVASGLIADFERKLADDRESIRKYEIVRAVLQRLNEAGEATLRERREVLKRVVEFEDFSTCWPEDQLKAKGLVAEIRRVIDVKDSFTRMRQERETERQKHVLQRQAEIKRQEERKAAIDTVRRDLGRLFSIQDPQTRGTTAEELLNRLFATYEILVRESFRRVSGRTGSVLEQIDGVVELDGEIYLVEVKWLTEPVSVDDVSRHLVRVFSRRSSRGIFVSATRYSESALTTCQEALGQAVVVLCMLEEIIRLLEQQADLKEFLKAKIRAAIVDKKPLYLIGAQMA